MPVLITLPPIDRIRLAPPSPALHMSLWTKHTVDLNGCLAWPTESDLELLYNLALLFKQYKN